MTHQIVNRGLHEWRYQLVIAGKYVDSSEFLLKPVSPTKRPGGEVCCDAGSGRNHLASVPLGAIDAGSPPRGNQGRAEFSRVGIGARQSGACPRGIEFKRKRLGMAFRNLWLHTVQSPNKIRDILNCRSVMKHSSVNSQ